MEKENTVTAIDDAYLTDGTIILIKDKTYEIIVDEDNRIGIESEYWDSPHFFSKANLHKFFKQESNTSSIIQDAVSKVLRYNSYTNDNKELVLAESIDWIAEQVILQLELNNKLKALSDKNELRREGQ
jgi:hypothetical protein